MPWSSYNINSRNEEILIHTVKNNKLARHVMPVSSGYYPNIQSITITSKTIFTINKI